MYKIFKIEHTIKKILSEASIVSDIPPDVSKKVARASDILYATTGTIQKSGSGYIVQFIPKNRKIYIDTSNLKTLSSLVRFVEYEDGQWYVGF